MRKYSKKLMLVAAVVIMLNFNSCSTYDEGPSFSLRTKTARLTGEWKIDKIDGTRVNQDVYLEFEDDGDFEVTYQYSYYGYSYTYRDGGEWEWEDGKESIELDYDDGYKDEWEIIKLTNDEFWFEDDDRTEYECEKED